MKDFTGKNGEPKNDKELYVLKSMWVMMCAEFEGSLKDLVENYIDFVKRKKNIKDMHVCFLLQNFYGNKEEKNVFTKREIMGLFKRKKSGISNLNFTKNKKSTYKSFSVEYLFNSLGIFFKDKEITDLKLLDGIASTRDSISHGDYQISITRKQLENNIPIIINIYKMLKGKLKINFVFNKIS
ncbi:MAG: MAE_28990/MAE_18760 family HEPN-like nuclease [Patescibacteria group bacterium]